MAVPTHLLKTARRQIRKIRQRGPRSEKEKGLLASADRQREQGLGWRYDGFSSWSDEQLMQALARAGVACDPDSFSAEARAAGSPTRLGELWDARSTAQGRFRDLVPLAARELWRRLLHSVRAAEVVADEVDELLEEAEVSAAPLAHWKRAAERLLGACLPQGVPDLQFWAKVTAESGSDLVGFMTRMPAALLGTPDAATAPDLYESFARLADRKGLLAERAEALAMLGRGPEALDQIRALLAEFPDDPQVLLKAGAVHEALGDLPGAQEFLRRWQLLFPGARRHPVGPAGPTPRVPQPGPNEKCPCGSGKKYKRCHGLAS